MSPLIAASIIVTALLVSCMMVIIRSSSEHCVEKPIYRLWYRLTVSSSLPTKAKIVIGFYQIATRMEQVYDLYLPAELRHLLSRVQFAISLGIDGIPLECIGASGYIPRLLFWTIVPMMIIGIGAGIAVIKIRCTHGSVSRVSLLKNVLPFVLRLMFLVYPVVTNVSFEAFSCFEFEDDGTSNHTSSRRFAFGHNHKGVRYLMADVSIECDSWLVDGVTTSDHGTAKFIAICAIFVYAVGFFVMVGCILWKSRRAILQRQPTALSNAAWFLHREYVNEPTSFWWELMEMCVNSTLAPCACSPSA